MIQECLVLQNLIQLFFNDRFSAKCQILITIAD